MSPQLAHVGQSACGIAAGDILSYVGEISLGEAAEAELHRPLAGGQRRVLGFQLLQEGLSILFRKTAQPSFLDLTTQLV